VQLLLAAGYVAHMAETAACMLAPVEDEPCAGVATLHALLVAAVAAVADESAATLAALLQCLAHLRHVVCGGRMRGGANHGHHFVMANMLTVGYFL
jgi:hypothetical protein